MDLEKQVCSLELSQKLKELGVKQESLFWWVISLTTNYHISYTGGDTNLLPTKRNDFFSAFTVAELGEILKKANCQITSHYVGGKGWLCDMSNWPLYVEKTEADARAKMLIYLLENKII